MNNNPPIPQKRFFNLKLTVRHYLTIRNILLVSACLVLGLIAGNAYTSHNSIPNSTSSTTSKDQQQLPVKIIPLEKVDSYSRQRHYTGLVHESRRSVLSFKRGGEVLKLLVDEGQSIKKNEILGHLDNRHIKAKQQKIIGQVNEAKAVLRELLAGPRKETIAAKRAELRARKSETEILSKQLTRRNKLVKINSITQEEHETYLFNLQTAEAQVDVVKSQLEELLAGTRKEKIEAQRARISQLDAQIEDINHDLEDTILKAPFSGRISQRYIDEGVVLQTGARVFEMVDDTHLEAWIGLPPNAGKSLTIGDEHKLEIDGEIVEAVVKSLSPDVSQTTRTRNIIFQLKPSDTVVLPGQITRLPISVKVRQTGFWIPTTSLTRGVRGLFSVYIAVDAANEPAIVERHDVELLDTIGMKSFVRGSIQNGDLLITSGTHRIVVGQKVRIQQESINKTRPEKISLLTEEKGNKTKTGESL